MRGVRKTLVLGCASALLLTMVVSPAAAYPAAPSSRHLSPRDLRQIAKLVRSRGGRPHRRGYLVAPTAHGSIVNGIDADQSAWGFAAFVQYNGDFFCSGTLIAPQVVLTAGHCATADGTTTALDPSGFRITTGSVDLDNQAATQVSGVGRVVVNPSYDDSNYSGDAALLVLSTPSTAPRLRLARSTETGLYAPGTVAEIAGWGLPYQGGDSPALLQAAGITVQDPSYCVQNNPDWYLESWETCAVDYPTFTTGTCNGDSGGPLITQDASGQPVVIGVTSVGPINCNTYTADYFTRTDVISGWANALVASLNTPTTTTTTTKTTTTTPPPTTTTTTTTSTTPKTTPPTSSPARAPKPPTIPALTMSEVRSYAATMVQARTHKRPRLTLTCSRVNAWTVHCSVRWKSGTSSYAVSGRFFHFLQGANAYWWYDVTGTHKWHSCRVQHGRRACTAYVQRFRWY